MPKSRVQKWLILIAIGVGMIPLAVLALWGFMSMTATPLHPKGQMVPSASLSAPRPQWASAVAEARQIARDGATEQNLPGVSVAVGIGGEVVWAEGFGWTDLQDNAVVAPDTRFRIGTASKVLTSAAAGLLIEQGKLKLDDEIQVYVPGYPKQQWPVTLRQLMAHTAGVRDGGGDEGPLYSQHCARTIDALPFFAKDALLFEPGTQYHYSSYGWILVSAAIEAAAGEPFFKFMRKQVFEPLGMNDTKDDASTEPSPNLATSYFPRFASDPRYGPDPMRPIDYSCYSGSSALLTTPSDWVRFAMAINTGKLLTPATVQLLQTSHRLPSGEETGYGLGWDLEAVTLNGAPTTAIGHDGELLGGTVSSLMTFRDRGIVVAIIANTSYADTASLALKIAEVFARR